VSNVIVRNVDTVNVRVETDAGVAREISDFFTYDVPGARFMPAFRNKMWDGKIRLFNAFNRMLPRGLLDHLAEFVRVREYTMEVSPELVEKGDLFDRNEIAMFLSSLNLTAAGSSITVYDHQMDAITTAINRERCLLLSPTASGKSLVIYSLVRWWLDRIQPHRKVLIVVPTISLVSQMISDFKDYSKSNGWDASTECHGIYGGEDKMTDARVVVSTWQSIYKLPRAYFDQFEAVIGDEAHLFKAQSLNGIMNKLVECPYRIALTGTLDGSKIHKLAIEGLFGPVHRVITTKELMDRNLLASLRIECLLLRYPPEIRKTVCGLDYHGEIEWLVNCEKRNEFIAHLASATRGNTLVLFNYVEKHGNPLYDLIQTTAMTAIENRKTFFVAGETEMEQREGIRNIVEKESNAIIVASYGTFSTGINIKSLKNVIFASPSKSRIRILQSIGRQLRKADGKHIAKLYDIADDLHHGETLNYTLRHFLKRVKIYESEEFRYKLVKMPIDIRIKRPTKENT